MAAIDCHNDSEADFSWLEQSGIADSSGGLSYSQKSSSCSSRTPSIIPFLSLTNSEFPANSLSFQSWSSRWENADLSTGSEGVIWMRSGDSTLTVCNSKMSALRIS